MKKSQTVGIVSSIVVIAVSLLLPSAGDISQVGMRTIGVLAAFLVLLVTEALPVVVVSLMFCALMPVLGIVPSFAAALSGYSEPIVFFVLASSGIAVALTTIPLSKRILRMLLEAFGKNIGQVLLSIMSCCALLSSIVSNVPCCAIFMTIALDFLKLYDSEEEKQRSARAFMIAIPVASMIGGMMTPAGSSINLLTMSLLEQHTGMEITFVQWMGTGIPMSLVMLPLAWWLMCKVYKPAEITEEQVHTFIASMAIPQRMDLKEWKVCTITAIMLVLWIASSWVKGINVMVVAMLGCCTIFLPGVDILDVKTFLRENSWDVFFLLGSVISIAHAMIANGVSDAIANYIPVMNISLPVLLAFTAILLFVTLLVIPVAPSMIPIMAAPLITIAASSGENPALIMLAAALCAGNCYLLPLDTVPLITYAKGHYSMTDMIKSTVFLQIAMVILCAVWLPLAGKLLGIG